MKDIPFDRLYVWQLPVRFYHWVNALAVAVLAAICIDYARRVHTERRGGGAEHLPFDESRGAAPEGPVDAADLLALHGALEELEALDARQAKIVELKYFVGLGEVEIAEALGISEATVKRDWSTARAWLYRELSGRKR